MNTMRHLLALLLTLSIISLSSCGAGEEAPEMEVVGNYNLVSLKSGDVELPAENFKLSLELKSDSTYNSNGFSQINSEISEIGKWSIDVPGRVLDLSGTNFDIKKFEGDTLKVSHTSASVEFTITLKR